MEVVVFIMLVFFVGIGMLIYSSHKEHEKRENESREQLRTVKWELDEANRKLRMAQRIKEANQRMIDKARFETSTKTNVPDAPAPDFPRFVSHDPTPTALTNMWTNHSDSPAPCPAPSYGSYSSSSSDSSSSCSGGGDSGGGGGGGD